MTMEKPDFIISGGYVDGEVILFASNELDHVTLTEISKEPTLTDIMYKMPWEQDPPEYHIYLTSELKSYTVVKAPTYPEAFECLFNIWSPEKKQEELEPQKAIDR